MARRSPTCAAAWCSARSSCCRRQDIYERYAAALPDEDRGAVLYALAASWVPARLLETHFQAIEALALSDAELSRMGEILGRQIMDSLFASMLRSARSAGADLGTWLALKQSDRIFSRMYNGGGIAIIQTGPKDAVFELHGLSVASSRYFRTSHMAFMRAAMSLSTRTCVVKPVAARRPSPGSFAISLSWV